MKPPAEKATRLFANEEGVWRQDGDGAVFGIRWEEIHALSGYTLAHFETPEVDLEFDTEYGESFCFNEKFGGFDNVVNAINARHMYIEDGWLENVRNPGEEDEACMVWERS